MNENTNDATNASTSGMQRDGSAEHVHTVRDLPVLVAELERVIGAHLGTVRDCAVAWERTDTVGWVPGPPSDQDVNAALDEAAVQGKRELASGALLWAVFGDIEDLAAKVAQTPDAASVQVRRAPSRVAARTQPATDQTVQTGQRQTSVTVRPTAALPAGQPHEVLLQDVRPPRGLVGLRWWLRGPRVQLRTDCYLRRARLQSLAALAALLGGLGMYELTAASPVAGAVAGLVLVAYVLTATRVPSARPQALLPDLSRALRALRASMRRWSGRAR